GRRSRQSPGDGRIDVRPGQHRHRRVDLGERRCPPSRQPHRLPGRTPPRRPPPWRGAPYCAGRIEGQALAGLEPADVADGRSAQDRRVAPEHSLKPLLAIQTNDDGTSHSKIHYGTTAIPTGLRKFPPEETTVCAPVVGLTRITPPDPPKAFRSATRMSPLAGIAIPTGSTKFPPEETTVCAPVVGSTRITPPDPPKASSSATRIVCKVGTETMPALHPPTTNAEATTANKALRAICFTSGGWNSICVAVEHGGRRRRTLRVLHIRACLATSCQAELGTKVASERDRYKSAATIVQASAGWNITSEWRRR